MTITTDDLMLRGVQFARDHLRIIETAYGTEKAMAYAAGMASGVRNVVADSMGIRAAFDLYSGLADDALDQQFKGQAA